MRRRGLSAGLFTVLTAALVGFFASPASANPTWERDAAKPGTPPSTKTCVSTTGVTGVAACWHANGDVWWVKDTQSNGFAAEARWYQYTTADGHNYYLDRNGACVNSLSQGHWGACNKNYPENGVVIWKGCNVDGGGGLHGCTTWAACHEVAGGPGTLCAYGQQSTWPPPSKLYFN